VAGAAADAGRIAGGGGGTSAPDDEDERRFFVGAVAVRCGATAADDEEEDDDGNDEDDDESSDDDDDSADEEEDDGDAVRLASITSASAELMGHGHRADGDCAAAPLAADGVWTTGQRDSAERRASPRRQSRCCPPREPGPCRRPRRRARPSACCLRRLRLPAVWEESVQKECETERAK
jgi:hypothetical protein